MGYLSSGFFRDTKAFWITVLAIAVWMAGGIDFFTNNRLFGGVFHDISLFFFIGIPAIYIIYRLFLSKRDKDDRMMVENYATHFEPAREGEIRHLLGFNPQFATMCYDCIYFNSGLGYCERKRAPRVHDRRVIEIKINNKPFCLYWQPHGTQPGESLIQTPGQPPTFTINRYAQQQANQQDSFSSSQTQGQWRSQIPQQPQNQRPHMQQSQPPHQTHFYGHQYQQPNQPYSNQPQNLQQSREQQYQKQQQFYQQQQRQYPQPDQPSQPHYGGQPQQPAQPHQRGSLQRSDGKYPHTPKQPPQPGSQPPPDDLPEYSDF